LIECTELFPGSEWACAHVEGSDLIRVNVQYANKINLIHMKVSKIASFLEAVRKDQEEPKAKRSCLVEDQIVDTRYSHLTDPRERAEAIRESNQRAGGDIYGG
jgi:hypothetical protein